MTPMVSAFVIISAVLAASGTSGVAESAWGLLPYVIFFAAFLFFFPRALKKHGMGRWEERLEAIEQQLKRLADELEKQNNRNA